MQVSECVIITIFCHSFAIVISLTQDEQCKCDRNGEGKISINNPPPIPTLLYPHPRLCYNSIIAYYHSIKIQLIINTNLRESFYTSETWKPKLIINLENHTYWNELFSNFFSSHRSSKFSFFPFLHFSFLYSSQQKNMEKNEDWYPFESGMVERRRWKN